MRQNEEIRDTTGSSLFIQSFIFQWQVTSEVKGIMGNGANSGKRYYIPEGSNDSLGVKWKIDLFSPPFTIFLSPGFHRETLGPRLTQVWTASADHAQNGWWRWDCTSAKLVQDRNQDLCLSGMLSVLVHRESALLAVLSNQICIKVIPQKHHRLDPPHANGCFPLVQP